MNRPFALISPVLALLVGAHAFAQSNSDCLATEEPITWTLPNTPDTPNWPMNLTAYAEVNGTLTTYPFTVTFWRRQECATELLATFNSSTAVEIGGDFSAFQNGNSNGFSYMTVDDIAVYPSYTFDLTFSAKPIQISGVLSEISPNIDVSKALTIDWQDPFTAAVTQVQIPAALSSTSPFAIGNGITGNWYDHSESGHGFGLEVLPGSTLLAEWYVFGPTGGRDWIIATGPITGNTATLTAFQGAGSGGRFPPNFSASQVQTQAWGTLTFTFTDCNNGSASWQPTAAGYTAGSIPITRLTMPAGLTCP